MDNIHVKRFDLFQLISIKEFRNLCQKWQADHRTRTLMSSKHVWTLVMAQVLKLESLREIEAGLGVRRSTLSDANASRPAGFFQDLCEIVLNRLSHCHPSRKVRRAVRTLLAIDATECRVHGSMASLLEWKTTNYDKNRMSRSSNKAAAKLHIVWNIKGEFVEDFRITGVRHQDLKIANGFSIQPNALYVFDRGYYSVPYWAKIVLNGAHFVTRLKMASNIKPLDELVQQNNQGKAGVLWDGVWEPTSTVFCKHPKLPKDIFFRHIIYKDPKENRIFHFLSSDWELSAQDIADAYKARWAVELLFKWLKGHTKMRYLPFKNPNAIKVQLAVIVLVQLLIQLYRTLSRFKCTLWECLRALRSYFIQNGISRAHAPSSRPKTSSIIRLEN